MEASRGFSLGAPTAGIRRSSTATTAPVRRVPARGAPIPLRPPRFLSIPPFFPGAGIRSPEEAGSANTLRELGDGVRRGSGGTCHDLDRWRRSGFLMETVTWCPGGLIWHRMGTLEGALRGPRRPM